jgi:hypothetical protein
MRRQDVCIGLSNYRQPYRSFCRRGAGESGPAIYAGRVPPHLLFMPSGAQTGGFPVACSAPQELPRLQMTVDPTALTPRPSETISGGLWGGLLANGEEKL